MLEKSNRKGFIFLAFFDKTKHMCYNKRDFPKGCDFLTATANRSAFRTAFYHTLPILAGYSFLGMSFGFLMVNRGYPLWLPPVMSVLIYAGSMQFVAVDLLAAAFHPAQAFLMVLMVNARHLFYGISLLDQYRSLGRKKSYMIFGLTDETFSVNYAAKVPEDTDRQKFMFLVTLLDHFYWVAGTTAGCVLGSFLHFNTEGLDFVMTAMFVVILTEQLQKPENRITALVGLGVSVLCLVAFGAGDFLIPAMLGILVVLTLLRKPLERRAAA